MEVRPAPAVGKRLWSYVRAALFMARNGKRKLLLTMHLLRANNNNKRKAVTNLLSHHGRHHANNAYALLRRGDYEFSCANSPADPAASSSTSRRRLAYFPCLGAVAENEDEECEYGYRQSDADAEPAPPLASRIDYYPSTDVAAAISSTAPREEEEYDACASPASSSPALLLPGAASGEFSVRVSNYSSEDYDDDAAGAAGSDAVDADAEEFIRRFYDQLRRQNTTVALQLPYYTQQESIIAAA